MPLLKPDQFSVNEAWIIFRLNDAPITTEADGDFNVLCLMDASSCYILGNEFVPTHLARAPKLVVERLIEAGMSKAQRLPQKLLFSLELETDQFAELAEQYGAEVSQVPEDELSSFTLEAREGFQMHIGGGKVQ